MVSQGGKSEHEWQEANPGRGQGPTTKYARSTIRRYWREGTQDPTGQRTVGKGRGKQGGQAQRKGRKNKIKRSQPDQTQSDHTPNQKRQGETKSNANGMGTASEHSKKPTEGVSTADTKERKGTKRKQERTDRGKVLKSRMLGLQTVQAQADGNCDWVVQRPGVRTRAMCRREERTKDMLLSTKDAAGDSGPRGIG
jgi:hypothetical protein